MILNVHAQCLVLKRVVDKITEQHNREMKEIVDLRKSVPENDGLLVDEFQRQLEEKRRKVLMEWLFEIVGFAVHSGVLYSAI